jgi:predicted Co/Zn/Cd cation transporter (cation efflux family)
MFLSAAVLASFALGWLSYDTSAEQYLDYLDPAVVAILCLLALPIPLKVLWENGREALLLAPNPAIQNAVIEKIEEALQEFPIVDHRIRMLKLGNVMSVTLHIRPADDFRVESISELDRIRRTINEAFAPLNLEIGLDVMFISDMGLAR